MLVLFVVDAVTDGNALALEHLLHAVHTPRLVHAGVEEQMPAVGHLHCAAGEAAVGVIGHIGSEGSREILPSNKVLCPCMSPVHGTPLGAVGMVLEEQMVIALVIAKAVGVVHPAHRCGEVIGGALCVGIAHILPFKVTGTLQQFTAHNHSPDTCRRHCCGMIKRFHGNRKGTNPKFGEALIQPSGWLA